jgi:WD40 repeat protein
VWRRGETIWSQLRPERPATDVVLLAGGTKVGFLAEGGGLMDTTLTVYSEMGGKPVASPGTIGPDLAEIGHPRYDLDGKLLNSVAPRRIVSRAPNGSLAVWDLEALPRRTVIPAWGAGPEEAKLDPGGTRLAVRTPGGIRLLDLEGAVWTGPLKNSGVATTSSLAFSPDGKWLVASGRRSDAEGGDALSVWETATGLALPPRPLPGEVYSLRVDTTGTTVTSVLTQPVGDGDTIQVHRLAGGGPILERTEVRDYAFDRNLSMLVVTYQSANGLSSDLVNLSSETVTPLLRKLSGQVVFDADPESAGVAGGRLPPFIATLENDRHRAWDVQTRKELAPGADAGWDGLAQSPSGTRVIARRGNDLSYYQAGNQRQNRVLKRSQSPPDHWVDDLGPAQVMFSADDRYLVALTGPEAVEVWDGQTGTQKTTLTGHSGNIEHFVCGRNANQHWLVTAADDATVRLWDLSRLAPL